MDNSLACTIWPLIDLLTHKVTRSRLRGQHQTNNWLCDVSTFITRTLSYIKVLLHSIGHPVCLGPDAWDRRSAPPPEMEWKGLIRSALESHSQNARLSPRDKTSSIGLRRLTHQPIKCSFTDYLATFTRFTHTRSLEREICLILQQYSLD